MHRYVIDDFGDYELLFSDTKPNNAVVKFNRNDVSGLSHYEGITVYVGQKEYNLIFSLNEDNTTILLKKYFITQEIIIREPILSSRLNIGGYYEYASHFNDNSNFVQLGGSMGALLGGYTEALLEFINENKNILDEINDIGNRLEHGELDLLPFIKCKFVMQYMKNNKLVNLSIDDLVLNVTRHSIYYILEVEYNDKFYYYICGYSRPGYDFPGHYHLAFSDKTDISKILNEHNPEECVFGQDCNISIDNFISMNRPICKSVNK